MFVEQVQIYVGDHQLLLVDGALRRDPVPGEEVIRRCQDRGLTVVGGHAGHEGQIAHGASHRDVDLVLNRAGLGAIADAAEAFAAVRAGRNEQNLGAGLGHHPGHLGELHVVTDQDGDVAEVGVVEIQAMAAAELVRAALRRRQVDFLLAEHAPVRREQVRRVENFASLDDGVGPGDDVDARFLRQPDEQRLVVGRQLGEAAHRQRRGRLIDVAEKLHREEFREQHEVAAIILGAAHEELNLAHEVLKAADRPEQVLDSGDAHAARARSPAQGFRGGLLQSRVLEARLQADRRRVFRVQPFQHRSETA